MQKGLFDDDEQNEEDSDEEGGKKGVRWDAGVVEHSRGKGVNRMGTNVSSGTNRSSNAGLISMNMNQTKIGFD